LGKYDVGCDFVSSMENFFKPKKGHYLCVFTKVRFSPIPPVQVLTVNPQFYSFLMSCSFDLNLLALLDAYVGPTPVTSMLVRGQLLDEDGAEEVREAIKARIRGEEESPGLYSMWLNHSGLDFRNKALAIRDLVQEGVLQSYLFELKLGPRVKSFQLGHYSEVHEFRELFGEFVGADKLWWDGINPTPTGHRPWVSMELRGDPSFLQIMESWLKDTGELQRWLDEFETRTSTVNNPGSENPVFSYKLAVEILNFGKVGHLAIQGDLLEANFTFL
jgi:hypothetical protein